MYSKNNIDRPVAEREYFDRPMDFNPDSYTFSPTHKRPIDMALDIRKINSSENSRFATQTKSSLMQTAQSTIQSGFNQTSTLAK